MKNALEGRARRARTDCAMNSVDGRRDRPSTHIVCRLFSSISIDVDVEFFFHARLPRS